MNSIFKVGDVVYTPDINDGRLVVGTLAPNGVFAGTGTDYKGQNSRWYTFCFVSFTPWPEPVHVRPLRDGLYVIKFNTTEDGVCRKIGEHWYSTREGKAHYLINSPDPKSLIYAGE